MHKAMPMSVPYPDARKHTTVAQRDHGYRLFQVCRHTTAQPPILQLRQMREPITRHRLRTLPVSRPNLASANGDRICCVLGRSRWDWWDLVPEVASRCCRPKHLSSLPSALRGKLCAGNPAGHGHSGCQSVRCVSSAGLYLFAVRKSSQSMKLNFHYRHAIDGHASCARRHLYNASGDWR
jgi:hypothetical protein